MPRAKAVVVRVEDRAGMLGRVASALSAANVNLRAVQAGNEGGQGVIRMVVDKLAIAKEVLAAHGWPAEEEEILEIELSDEPGTLGEAATLLGNAAVNIRYVFVTTAGARKATAFLSVSDMEAALRVLG
jgi:hypothetical protein